MSIKELTSQELADLVDTRHAATGVAYAPRGLQPYYEWLLRSVHLLAESSAGAFRVAKDDESDTSIIILPGRASISGVALEFPGDVMELAAYNNDTALVWLEDNAGQTDINVTDAATGWPGGSHIKLAEVTLVAGEITQIIDRRFETILKA